MHGREADTPNRSRRRLPGAAAGRDRFDAESGRRILERAAAEQQRMNNAFADSWSLEELQEMAAEAGISSEVLRAAVEAHGSRSGTPAGAHEGPRSGWSALKPRKPRDRSKAAKAGVLTAAVVIVVAGLLLAFPAVAQTVLWALLLFLVVLSVLILLGAAPF